MEEIKLSPEQEQKIIDFWNRTPETPPDIRDIIQHVFEKELDGRSKEGKAVKVFLSRQGKEARTTTVHNKIEIDLSEQHKKFIESNPQMKPFEIARVLFNNPILTNLHAETRAVAEYAKTLDNSNRESVNEVPEGKWEPPKHTMSVIKRVNDYLQLNWEKDKLSPSQKKNIDALFNYLKNFRFTKQMNSYFTEDDRKSCEDAFIRYTYDKPDLSQEQVDQYIVLANEVVLGFKAQRRSERLQQMLEEVTSTDPESAKIAMSLVEAIGKATTEYNLCVKRQQDLLDDLTEKRSEKLSKQIRENASVLNLIQEWKQEETRKKYIKLAEIEQRAVAQEVDRLTSMEEIRAKILGLTEEEIKYG